MIEFINKFVCDQTKRWHENYFFTFDIKLFWLSDSLMNSFPKYVELTDSNAIFIQ